MSANKKWTVSAWIVAVFVIGCGVAATGLWVNHRAYSVRGSVIDVLSLDGIADAKVELVSAGVVVAVTETSFAGRFSVKPGAPVTSLRVRADGYKPKQIAIEAERKLIAIRLAPAGGAVGTVVAASSGRRVSDAEVSCIGSSTRTNEDGGFDLLGCTGDVMLIRVAHPEYQSVVVNAGPNLFGEMLPIGTVHLPEGELAAVALSGIVHDPTLAEVDARVLAVAEADLQKVPRQLLSTFPAAEARAQPDGSFQLSLHVGRWEVTALSSDGRWDRTSIEVQGLEPPTLVFTLPTKLAIVGTVKSHALPVEGAAVRARHANAAPGHSELSAVTNATGEFYIEVPETGVWVLEASGRNLGVGRERVEAGTSGVTLELLQSGMVGTIYTANNISNARGLATIESLDRRDAPPYWIRFDGGQFTARGLKPGKYSVRPFTLYRDLPAQAVLVKDGVATATWAAPEPGRMRGRIVDKVTGVPVRAATVQPESVAGRSVPLWGQAVTDSDGRFAFDSIGGPFALRIKHDDYESQTILINVPPGETIELGNLALKPTTVIR